jgi:hypothetical protein
MARIDAGTFGLCENGGEHIDEKRLEAIPRTRYCSAHEAEAATGPGRRRVTLRRDTEPIVVGCQRYGRNVSNPSAISGAATG